MIKETGSICIEDFSIKHKLSEEYTYGCTGEGRIVFIEKKTASAIMLTLLLTSMLTLAFNIQPVKASGTIYIRADGSIDPSTAPISTVDNVTYTFTDNISEPLVVQRNNIIVDGANRTVQGSGSGAGINLTERSNVTIKNMEIKAFQYGIYLRSSLSNSISGNNITNNWNGISLYVSSNYNGIFGNNIKTNTGWGIDLHSSSYNSIFENNIISNTNYGIYFESSSSNSISKNNITDNWNGVHLYLYSDCNRIFRNSITANKKYGVYLSYSSNNSISGNNLTANLWCGVYLYLSSNYNRIYHNNFVNNTPYQADVYSSTSDWDNGYPSGGNYWSNYTGTDFHRGPYQNETGSDGIGDTAYIIDASNQDRYPLMKLQTEIVSMSLTGTSPHVANGTDFSEVRINATDISGDPVIGAEIVVVKRMGEDDKEEFSIVDYANETYIADVSSTLAGDAQLYAFDTITGLAANVTVRYDPGPLARVKLTATNPREAVSRDTSNVTVMALDEFNNKIMPERVNMTLATDMGVVGTLTSDENGVFHTTLVSNDLGIANLTATVHDLLYDRHVNETTQVNFPAIYFSAPKVALVESTFIVPVNVYVSDPMRALGYYDLVFSFNSSIMRFVNASDGNPSDEFETPNVEIGLCMGSIRISQRNNVSLVSPTGSVDVANLTFRVVGSGQTWIDIGLRGGYPASLLDTFGVPLPPTYPPNVCKWIDLLIGKKPPSKKICLNINIAKCSGLTKPDVDRDVACLKMVFLKNCVPIQVEVCTYNEIDVKEFIGDDCVMDEFKKLNEPTKEEQQLLGNSKFRKECCVNVFYVKNLSDGSNGEAIAPKAFEDYDGDPATGKGPKPEQDLTGIALAKQRVCGTLAHELIHVLMNTPPDKNDHNQCTDPTKGQWDPDNAMNPYGTRTPVKDCGYKLNQTCQIDKMVNSPLLKDIKATDAQGKEKEKSSKCYYYQIGEDIYITGAKFAKFKTVDIYLIPDGADFNASNAIAMALATTDENGTVPVTYLWTVNQIGYYDIWVDYNRNGIADPGEYITHQEVGSYRITTVTHDTATVNVKPYKTVIGQGYNVPITVTVENQGDMEETLCVALYYTNLTDILLGFQIITVPSGNFTTVIFSWNTSGFAKGNYTVWAYAWPVPGETDTADNTYTGDNVYVGIPGDVNANGKVDMIDIGYICLAYASYPGHPKWNPNADINDDGKVDMKDIGYACMHYGQHDP